MKARIKQLVWEEHEHSFENYRKFIAITPVGVFKIILERGIVVIMESPNGRHEPYDNQMQLPEAKLLMQRRFAEIVKECFEVRFE